MRKNPAVLLIAPSIYLCCLYVFVLNQEIAREKIPSLLFRGHTDTLETVLPIHPKTMTQAWLLGQLDGKLQLWEENNQVLVLEDLLNKAQEIVGRSVNVNQIHDIGITILCYLFLILLGKIIAEMEEERGLVQRVLGFFSFINIIWFFSICGILVACSNLIRVVGGVVVTVQSIQFKY